MVPLVEITLFVQIGGEIGIIGTLLIIVATAAAGAFLIRRQGLAILQEIALCANEGRDVGKHLLHGFLILVAGLLMLTPGFLTDSVGISLAFPAVRQALIAWAGRFIAARAAATASNTRWRGQSASNVIVEGSYVSIDPDKSENRD